MILKNTDLTMPVEDFDIEKNIDYQLAFNSKESQKTLFNLENQKLFLLYLHLLKEDTMAIVIRLSFLNQVKNGMDIPLQESQCLFLFSVL